MFSRQLNERCGRIRTNPFLLSGANSALTTALFPRRDWWGGLLGFGVSFPD